MRMVCVSVRRCVCAVCYIWCVKCECCTRFLVFFPSRRTVYCMAQRPEKPKTCNSVVATAAKCGGDLTSESFDSLTLISDASPRPGTRKSPIPNSVQYCALVIAAARCPDSHCTEHRTERRRTKNVSCERESGTHSISNL